MADALTVGLAIGVIMACLYFALAKIFLGHAIWRATVLLPQRGLVRALAERGSLAEGSEIYCPPPEIIVPPTYRQRVGTIPDMGFDWKTATPEERAEAALGVLPTHFTDSNGISARDVAHRLGLDRPQQVTAALSRLRSDGRATSHWDKPKGRRVYWRKAD